MKVTLITRDAIPMPVGTICHNVEMKPGKGGAGGSGILNNGGNRTPGDNSVTKSDGQRANNKQGGQQQQQPKGGNQ